MKHGIRSAPVFALAILLPACGGSGGGAGGLASTPPPAPTPTPTTSALPPSPVNVAGNYDLISVGLNPFDLVEIESKAGEISVGAETARRRYTISFLRHAATAGPLTFDTIGDGTNTRSGKIDTKQQNSTGYESFITLKGTGGTPLHASLGSWTYVGYESSRLTSHFDYNFVFGNRTPANGIPVSGTATYTASEDGLLCPCAGSMRLSADFASRIMDAQFDLGEIYDGNDFDADNVVYLQANGQGPISSLGEFAFGLAGTAQIKPPDGAAGTNHALTGSLLGAFFGPQAQEAGGVFQFRLPVGYTLAGSFAAPKN